MIYTAIAGVVLIALMEFYICINKTIYWQLKAKAMTVEYEYQKEQKQYWDIAYRNEIVRAKVFKTIETGEDLKKLNEPKNKK